MFYRQLRPKCHNWFEVAAHMRSGPWHIFASGHRGQCSPRFHSWTKTHPKPTFVSVRQQGCLLQNFPHGISTHQFAHNSTPMWPIPNCCFKKTLQMQRWRTNSLRTSPCPTPHWIWNEGWPTLDLMLRHDLSWQLPVVARYVTKCFSVSTRYPNIKSSFQGFTANFCRNKCENSATKPGSKSI